MSEIPNIHITVLGSGTSSGVPAIGCSCEVCRSTDPRDKRLRPSILLRYAGRNVVVDTSPDFRAQVLRANLERLDAVLYTHSHADHVLGLDDIRPFNFRQKTPTPIYGSAETLEVIQRIFRYAFDEGPTQSSVPKLDLRTLDGSPFELFGLEFTPIRLCHGNGTVLGFRFGRAAYLTDHSDIPEESRSQAERIGRPVSGCAAAPSSSDALDRGAGAALGGRIQTETCVLHAHVPRPVP